MAEPINIRELDPNWLIEIHNALQKWFSIYGRSFPWRDTSNPFEILVAEKLLQQTAAKEHVVTIYKELINRFPNPNSLAKAELNELQTLLAPLGLFRRSQELIELSKQIVANYDGEVPHELNSLRSLNGVGEYIARAVMCFGFGHSIAVVDTNIARWLHRLFLLSEPIPANPARNRKLLDLATQMVPPEDAKIYNWAILDLCTAICTPKSPKCPTCPVQKNCAFGQN